MPELRPCTYCKHVYIKICDGASDCPNRIWLEEKQRANEPKAEIEKTKKE